MFMDKTAAASRPPLMTEFHAASIREFIEEFPNRKAKVERLIREKKIRVIDDENLNPRKDMICQRCNRTIPVDANYCPYCAHPVISTPAEAVAQRPQMMVHYTDADTVREYIEECPTRKTKVERLIQEKRIVIDEQKENLLKPGQPFREK
jgi:hypothetical protein